MLQEMRLGRLLDSRREPIHGRHILLQHGDVVAERKRVRIERGACALERALGRIEALQIHIGRDRRGVGKDEIGIDRQGAL